MTVGGAMAGIASIATETTNSHVQMWQSHLTASSRARHHFSSVDNDGIRDESTDGNAVVKWHTKMYSMFSSGSPWPENERLINVVPLSFRLGNSRFFPYTQRSQLRRVEWKMEWNASVRFPWDGKITRICVDFLFFRTRNLSLFSNRFPRLITNCTRAPHRDKLSYVAKVTAAASRWSIFAHNKSKFTIYHCDWLWQQRQGMGFRVFQVPGKNIVLPTKSQWNTLPLWSRLLSMSTSSLSFSSSDTMASSSSSVLFFGSHVILFSFLSRLRALANHVDTCVSVIFVIIASIIFSPFVGYGFFLCSLSQAFSVAVDSRVAFFRRAAKS